MLSCSVRAMVVGKGYEMKLIYLLGILYTVRQIIIKGDVHHLTLNFTHYLTSNLTSVLTER